MTRFWDSHNQEWREGPMTLTDAASNQQWAIEEQNKDGAIEWLTFELNRHIVTCKKYQKALTLIGMPRRGSVEEQWGIDEISECAREALK